jgi:hypothetical protein
MLNSSVSLAILDFHSFLVVSLCISIYVPVTEA